jgi:DNA-binding GntR family transcriptional regulator
MPAIKQRSQLLKRKTFASSVYEILEERIVSGKLAPGSPIAEERIATEFGVSRSPVRHAIAELERRGLAEWADKRDRQVAVPSAKFVADVYDTCSLLEAARICRSSREAPESDRVELHATVKAMSAARKAADTRAYQRHLGEMRALMVRRCDNDRLNRLSADFDIYRRWIQALVYRTKADYEESDREHRDIAQLYIDQDIPRLNLALDAHTAHHRAHALAAFEKMQAAVPDPPARATPLIKRSSRG